GSRAPQRRTAPDRLPPAQAGRRQGPGAKPPIPLPRWRQSLAGTRSRPENASRSDRNEVHMKPLFLATVLVSLCDSVAFAQWRTQTIDTKADFRGLCVVGPDVAWVSGTTGTYARTTDRGKTWSIGTVSGAEKLDFRAVKAFGEA